jgi:hypothetical protein
MMSLANCKVDKSTGEVFMPQTARGDPQKKQFYTLIYVNNKAAPLPYLREMEQVNKWILEGLHIDRLSMVDDILYSGKFCKEIIEKVT